MWHAKVVRQCKLIDDLKTHLKTLNAAYQRIFDEKVDRCEYIAKLEAKVFHSETSLKVTQSAYQRIFDEKAARCEYIAKLEGYVAGYVKIEAEIVRLDQACDSITALANFRGITQDIIKEAESNDL
jgi:hypothetical protein